MRAFDRFAKFTGITAIIFLFISTIAFADIQPGNEFMELLDGVNSGQLKGIDELIDSDIVYVENYGDYQESYKGKDNFLNALGFKISDDAKFEIKSIEEDEYGIFIANGVIRDYLTDLMNIDEGIRVSFKFSTDEGEINYLEYSENEEDLNAFFKTVSATIGVEVKIVENKLVVQNLAEGKSAKLSGIMAGDIIEAIDDKNVSEMEHGLEEMIYRIKGPDRTTVNLKINRDGKILYFTLLRTETDRELLYQVSTIQSLIAGNYDGSKDVSKLKAMGDFGIGTFDGLDGELLMIDNKVYKVKATGEVEETENSELIPFAAVTFLDADLSGEITDIDNIDELKADLDKFIDNKDAFYAFRIDGLFKTVKARSVPKQSKPYPILSEVTKNQSIFEYENVEGTLVGFWCPEYVGGINVPGYHLHFISNDRTLGGHLLDITFDAAQVFVDSTLNFNMELPSVSADNTIDNVASEIEKVE